MTITAPASFSKIRSEFGTGSTSLKAYVRGGAIVDSTSNTTGIPTSATGMAISDFVGACSLVATYTPLSLSSSGTSRQSSATYSANSTITPSGGISGTYTVTASSSNSSITCGVTGSGTSFVVSASATVNTVLVDQPTTVSGTITITVKRSTTCTYVFTMPASFTHTRQGGVGPPSGPTVPV